MYVAATACAGSLVLVALIYRPPLVATQSSGAASFMTAFRLGLTGRELALTLLAGAVWSFYNVGFIVVVSFAPDFLTAAGRSVADAGAVASIAIWLALVSVPLGGFLAERSGRPNVALVLSLAVYGAVIAALTVWDAPILLFAIMGLVNGVPAGIIMALPARAVRAEVLAPAMGLYFTCYYVGMATLPAAAGWARDAVGYAGAPLLFVVAILIVALLAFAAFCWVEARPSATLSRS
jgi:MFS family permease